MEKPVAEPVRSIKWNDAIIYIEEKYGLPTEGNDHPVTVLYYYLTDMGYIPEHHKGFVRIPFEELTEEHVPKHLAIARNMTQEKYNGILFGLIKIIVVEFPLNTENVYWEF